MEDTITPWVGIWGLIAVGGASVVITGMVISNGTIPQFMGGAIIAVAMWRARRAQIRHLDRQQQRDEQLAAIWSHIEKELGDK